LKENPIKKVLVANRGEIAIRIFRACTELGLKTVSVYAYEDKFSLHRYKADESYQVGKAGKPVQSYLDIDEVIRVAKSCNVDAVHPGYGFLSERADFAKKLADNGILFIGPSVDTLNAAGSKIACIELAKKLSVPTLSSSKEIKNIAEAKKKVSEIGYPIMIKASAGGGGRGMRKVFNENELESQLDSAKGESMAAFGKGEVYIEKLVRNAKHIEVQLFGDGTGNVVHLFERDCSIQRRSQKLIEIAPSITLDDETLNKIYTSALSLAKELKLMAAATAEFLVDESGEFFFIEINPRIQVEHTVTEEITGVDLVQSQIQVTSGLGLKDLGLEQDKITKNGVAIQCRVTTENPAKGFEPSYGKLLTYRSASGFGIRLDAGSAFTGAEITPFYDSMLVKITAKGASLERAASKMRRALSEFRIRGVDTNVTFLENVLSHAEFYRAVLRLPF